jgi:hypothetical protein
LQGLKVSHERPAAGLAQPVVDVVEECLRIQGGHSSECEIAALLNSNASKRASISRVAIHAWFCLIPLFGVMRLARASTGAGLRR